MEKVSSFSYGEESKEKMLILRSVPDACSAFDFAVWMREAAGLFREGMLVWLAMGAAMAAISSLMVYGLVFFDAAFTFGHLWQVFLAGLFVGGVITAAASLAEEDDLRFAYLFAGFRYKFKSLFILYLLMTLLFILPPSAAFYAASYTFSVAPLELMDEVWVWLLLAVFGLAALMALWFAPALIVLHDIKPEKAIKMSFRAGAVNLFSLLIYCIFSVIVYHTLNRFLPWMAAKAGSDWVVYAVVALGNLAVVYMALVLYVSYRNVWTNLKMHWYPMILILLTD